MPKVRKTRPMPAERHPLVLDNLGLAHAFARGWRNKLIPLDDRIQMAMRGLCLAARGFDPGRRIRFSTYAHAAMKAMFRRQWKDDMRAKRGFGAVMRQWPEHRDGKPAQFAARPDGAMENVNLHDYLEGLIDRLADERLALVLRRRFFEGKILAEVGIELGLSKERVRQMQIDALVELRTMIEWDQRSRRPDWLNQMKAGNLSFEFFAERLSA